MIYFPTHARCGPWLIGMLIGYIMFHTREKKLKINKPVNTLMWISTICLMMSIIFGFFPFQVMTGNTTTLLENAFFNATFRIGWGLAIGWIIFACQNGSGGPVGWFLSLGQWQPIARMGLSVYLTHRIYEWVSVLSQKQLPYFDFIHVVSSIFIKMIQWLKFNAISETNLLWRSCDNSWTCNDHVLNV